MTPEASTQAGTPAARAAVKPRNVGRPVLTMALVLLSIGLAAYLVVLFAPLASAAGGCGGG